MKDQSPSYHPIIRLSLRRFFYGFDDLVIAGATAQIAAKRLFDLGRLGPVDFVQQLGAGHEEAGNAVAALHRPGLDESFLQRVHLLPVFC